MTKTVKIYTGVMTVSLTGSGEKTPNTPQNWATLLHHVQK